MRKETGKMNRQTLLWLNQTIGSKACIFLLTLVEAALGISSVVFALFLRMLINRAADGDLQGFIRSALWFLGLVILQLLLQALRRYLTEFSRATYENRLKDRLFQVLLHKDYGCVSAVHSGEWMNRLTSDTVVVADGLTEIIPGLTSMVVRLIGALAALVVLEPFFVFFLIPGGAALMLLSYLFRRILKQMHRRIQEADGSLRVYLQEHLGSMVTIRSFAQEERVQREASERMEEHKKTRMRRNHFSNFCNVGFGAVMNGAYLFAAIYCSYGILQGTVSYGTFTAILQLVSQMQNPFANITGYLPKYYALLASAERLMQAEQFPDEAEEFSGNEDCQPEHILEFYHHAFVGIRLEQIRFSYPPNGKEEMPVVLDGASLEIHKGDFIALTGMSGCGKSTILKLILCLYHPQEGTREILFHPDAPDDIRKADSADARSTDPMDIRDMERTRLTAAWRRLFAYVPQNNELMSGTIRESVAFSDEERMRDEEGLRRALTIACADGFVDVLEDGIDTRLGEDGMGLSEGQLQRIAIARAIFSERPILLLDESTSALDEETEERLLNNLRKMTDKTVLIVTHRPAALRVCNRVITFSDGSIV